MLIVDAQIHLWAKGTPSFHHRQTPFLKEEALAGMDEAGIDRAVIHPVMWDPDSNELAIEAVRAHPDRFAIMGWFYLDQPDQRAAIETWKSRPGMKGLRFYFSDPRSQSWPEDGTLDWLWNGWTFPFLSRHTHSCRASGRSPNGTPACESVSIIWERSGRHAARRRPIATCLSCCHWPGIRTWR